MAQAELTCLPGSVPM